ncbi:hypothetical protein MNBD_BACTEROID03-770 [hydrothermal vent metagenome]|uniref:Transposase IS66 central domain-containing protein n=1 Tax=hydrothermal vent metagenome TaxID=652676 RepID=A0A3B0T9L3_9ZZZZ
MRVKLKRKINQDRYNRPIPDRDGILEKLKGLLEKPLKEDHKNLQAFYRRMVKYEHCIFTFLHSHHVPPDNNATERAIRNVKVKHLPTGRESLRAV